MARSESRSSPTMLSGAGTEEQLVETATVADPFDLQRHYLDGVFRESLDGGVFDTVNPATDEVLALASSGTAVDVDAAVAAARRAFDHGPWPRMAASERARVLERVADLIRGHADEFIELEVLDTGVPVAQTVGLAARAAENFDFYARVIRDLHGRAYEVGGEFLNYTVRKPVGVAALIMPWNAPLMLSTWRIAPALAAGNTVILKPAEWSPLYASLLAQVFAEAELPLGVFNVVQGFGEAAGAPLSAHPGVDLVCFTGETTTGQQVMAAGAPTLKRSSFELGGKSPVVVFADADPDRVVDAALAQVFTMNGQRCTAGSRLLVERSIYEQTVEAVADRAKRVRVGDPFDRETELGPLISKQHYERVCGYIQSARDQGARIVAGGERPDWLPQGNFLQATVIADVEESMDVFQEEIFGPVLAVTPFGDEADAIRLANATPYGLAAYVWTNDLTRAHRVARAIDTGMCWINSQNVRDLRTPFGGVKSSGIGREGGDYAFDFYCNTEVIHVALGAHPILRLGMNDS